MGPVFEAREDEAQRASSRDQTLTTRNAFHGPGTRSDALAPPVLEFDLRPEDEVANGLGDEHSA